MSVPAVDPGMSGIPMRPKRFPWLPVALGCTAGCAVLGALAIFAVIAVVRGVKTRWRTVQPPALHEIALITAGHDRQAYAAMAPEARATVTEPSFHTAMVKFRTALGTAGAPRMYFYQITSNNGRTLTHLYYYEPGSRSNMRLIITLMPVGRGLQPAGIWYAPWTGAPPRAWNP